MGKPRSLERRPSWLYLVWYARERICRKYIVERQVFAVTFFRTSPVLAVTRGHRASLPEWDTKCAVVSLT